MNNEYGFEGYDYSELAKSLGVILDEDLLDPSVSITTFLRTLPFFNVNYKETVSKCRCYLTAHHNKVAEMKWTGTPVWEGLLKVEDDFTFMQFFADLVGHMWY